MFRAAARSRLSLLRRPLGRPSVRSLVPTLHVNIPPSLSAAPKCFSSTGTFSAGFQDPLVDIRQMTRKLPMSCPGCGAPSQTVAHEEAGFYTLTRSAVKKFIQDDTTQEDRVFQDTLKSVDKNLLKELGLDKKAATPTEQPPKQTPICDRCHNLLHHHAGVPIFHPSIDSIRSIIEESPHKYNHIYHVLDAADFPMSLIPNLMNRLDLPPLRTQNRRSKHQKFVHDRVADISFIITRSDLLAPRKEQVDSLMPYLRETLRDALGRVGRNVRLGGLRCVSSKRGWWTKQVKEDIWDKGGAAWMVGKVNVGKSNLFEVAFPKGRGSTAASAPKPLGAALEPDTRSTELNVDEAPSSSLSPEAVSPAEEPVEELSQPELDDEFETFDEDEGSLLPPPQVEVPYPVMPVISSLPGTTASPIRIPFGGGKGELIDLPGVARSNLDEYVLPEHQEDLVMRTRVVPEQLTIKPGQSLVLGGGLIRITPTTPDLVFLSYSFLPLDPHVTATDKAVALATGEAASGVRTIMTDEAHQELASAGTFELKWDVTRDRAGPLTSKSAVKLKPEQLPFRVYSADILVEGVGWIELVAQVRAFRRKKPAPALFSDGPTNTVTPSASSSLDADVMTWKPMQVPEQQAEESTLPQVEVFSPKGKFIGIRPPMGAWLLGGKKDTPTHARKSRPRMSIKSLKHSQRGREAQREG